MNLAETLLLGLIAGGTIVIGLPVGRMRSAAMPLRLFLNAVAVGVLLFLVWDVLSGAWEPIDAALGRVHEHSGGLASAIGYGLLFAGGLSVGLLSLVAYDRYMHARARSTAARPVAATVASAVASDPSVPADPGATGAARASATAVLTETVPAPSRGISGWSAARRLALLIAVGIGLHNFAEGLAIGQSAARNEIALATMLVVGFALHNATEGFGIVAPLAGDVDADGVARRPGWGFLLAMALIGGGPTFVGTAVGHSVTSEPVSVLFLTLAAGSIIYVVTQLLGVAAKAKRPDLLAYGLLVGLFAGFLTDAIVTAAGV